jgi:type IV pilus assembly protein PilE
MLVALGVVAVLATLAVPNLSEALQRSRRIEAVSALGALQQAQERHRGTEPAYTTDIARLGWPDARSASGSYTLEVERADDTGYRLVARASSPGPQAGDVRCATLVVQVQGAVTTRGSTCRGCALAEPLSDTARCWGSP